MSRRNVIKQAWHAIEAWRITESESLAGSAKIQSEYAIWRMSALMGTVLLIAINFNDVFGVAWVAGYAFFDYLDRKYSAELISSRSAIAYYKSQAAFLSALLMFRSMVVYLWYYDHPTVGYLALVVVLVATRSSGTALHRMSSRLVISAFADLTVILFLAVQFSFYAPHLLDGMYIGIALFGLAVYYVISTAQSVEKLRSVEQLEQKNRQAQKMEAVGRLTGGVAHDFNNILTVIIGNIDLARETKLNPEADDLLDKTNIAATRAAELTSQLLAFSRQSPLMLREHELAKLLHRSVSLTQRLLPPNVEISLETKPGLWSIKTDAIQLETAILNLLTNARDAMPRGGLIAIKARNLILEAKQKDLPSGPYIELEIKDAGKGIPQSILGQVTEPFFTTKPVGKGSGLGLSMVKGFVEQTGGALEIDSVPGTSTTVTLYLRATGQIRPSTLDDTGI